MIFFWTEREAELEKRYGRGHVLRDGKDNLTIQDCPTDRPGDARLLLCGRWRDGDDAFSHAG